MKCQECVDNLSEYIDGRLADADAAQVEGHLRTCDRCRKVEEELRATIALVGTVECRTAPSGLAEKVASRLERQLLLAEQPARKRRLLLTPWRFASVGAAVAAALLVAVYLRQPQPSGVSEAAKPMIGGEESSPVPGVPVVPPRSLGLYDEKTKDGEGAKAPSVGAPSEPLALKERARGVVEGEPQGNGLYSRLPQEAPAATTAAAADTGAYKYRGDSEGKAAPTTKPTTFYAEPLEQARGIAAQPSRSAGRGGATESGLGESGRSQLATRREAHELRMKAEEAGLDAAGTGNDEPLKRLAPAARLEAEGQASKTLGKKAESAEVVAAEEPADDLLQVSSDLAHVREVSWYFDGKLTDAANEFLKLVPAIETARELHYGDRAEDAAAKPVPGVTAAKAGAGKFGVEDLKAAAAARGIKVAELTADKAVLEYTAGRAEIVRITSELSANSSLSAAGGVKENWPISEEMDRNMSARQRIAGSYENRKSAISEDKEPTPVTVRFVFLKRPAPAVEQAPAQTK